MTEWMATQLIGSAGVVALAGSGIGASALAHRGGVPNAVSRYAAAYLGGVALLVAVLFLEATVATGVAVSLAAGLVAVKKWRASDFAGVAGDLASQRWSEATFAAAAASSLAIGWLWLGNPWLGFLPAAFMAWGDATAGLTRATVWRDELPSMKPTVAMLGVGLVAALLYPGYWIGAAGAVAATIAERKRPRWGVLWDDNVNVVVASLTVMALLEWVGG